MNCKFEVRNTSTEEELWDQIAAHAKHAHNIQQITPELREKIKSAIKK